MLPFELDDLRERPQSYLTRVTYANWIEYFNGLNDATYSGLSLGLHEWAIVTCWEKGGQPWGNRFWYFNILLPAYDDPGVLVDNVDDFALQERAIQYCLSRLEEFYEERRTSLFSILKRFKEWEEMPRE